MTAGAAPTRADVCVIACAEAWRGAGEILVSPFGTVPTIAARLARLTFSPDLLLSDGEAMLLGETPPLGVATSDTVVEGWLPFRLVFDVVAGGRRHVMMMPSQLDAYGNMNISAIGDHARPSSQLIGARGAPGNTVNHATSYWVPRHSTRVFTPAVDVVCGVGSNRARAAGPAASRFHGLRVVVTDKAVFDFATDDGRMRLVSVHPGVTVDEVLAATGFPPARPDAGGVPETRVPSPDEQRIIDTLDPKRLRDREVTA